MAGVADAFEAMFKEPEAGPADCGLKFTLIVQREPADRTTPQELVWRKPAGAVMLMIVKTPVPGFEKSTGWELLAEPTVWLPKAKLGVETAEDGQAVMQTFARKPSSELDEQFLQNAWKGITVGKSFEKTCPVT